MYLTRMPLNPARRGARHLLASPQRVHAAVLAGFPPQVGPVEGRVLWRLDQGAQSLHLLVASPDRPDFTHIAEQVGWPTQAAWETADYAPFLDRIAAGQRWVFRLTANPVRSARTPAGGRGKRVSAGSVAHQTEWLLSRSEALGFAIPSGSAGAPNLRVDDRSTRRFERQAEGSKRIVTVSSARYDGVLDVTDADSLRAALAGGIGSAKAYGCGLMTLAPAR